MIARIQTAHNTHTHKKNTTHKLLLFSFFLIFLKVRGGQVLNVEYQCDVVQASNSKLKQCPQSFKAHLRTYMTPPGAISLMSHSPFPAQINGIFPFIYSCIITAANCFVNGTAPSASPVNTMSLAMLIILLFAWPGGSRTPPVFLDSITAV